MEAEKKQRIFYSVPMKILVVVLTFVGILMCGIFGGAVLSLGTISGADPFGLDEQTEYQETEGCGEQMVYDLSHLSNNLEDRSRYDKDGTSGRSRRIDIIDDTAPETEADDNTSYAMEDLYTLYNSGIAEELRDIAVSSQELAQGEYPGYAAESSDVAYSDYYLSENVWKHLQSVAGDTQFSQQFLYLYGYGYQLELDAGVRTSAGGTLADYAAAHSNEVSLYDLYIRLNETAENVAAYMWALEDTAALQNSNLCYYITDGSRVYTNVNTWKDMAPNSVEEQISAWPMRISYERENGNIEENSYFPETRAGYRLSEYLSINSILSDSETVYAGLRPGYPMADSYQERAERFDTLIPSKNMLLFLTVAGLVLTVVSLIAGTFQSGRNPENKEIRLYAFDCLPTEVGVSIGVLAAMLGIGFVSSFYYTYDRTSFTPLMLVYAVFSIVGEAGLYLLLYYALVRRIKAHNLWEKSWLRAVIRLGRRAYAARKASTRVIWAGIFLIFLHFLFLPTAGFFGFILCLVVDILILLYLLRDAAGKQTVEEGLKQIGSGNLDYKVDTGELRGDNLELARVVNGMGEGLKEAVSRQMKNERMQADLITNVSHDLKTPLTSIINYVDLLKRENIEDPRIRNYIDVLERKSQRLKQLAEDLVEASRASSGNVKLEIVTLNLNELVQQVNGEFSERFSGRNLELICHLPLESALLNADGRYIWRVLENLYGNAAKYSMPSTRIYVDVMKKAGMVMFSIKNISERTLNISADELMERFVRGDSSRTTEGSGLGLSIAKNLVTLMGGSFELYVDGDLFKAMITFPEAQGKENLF